MEAYDKRVAVKTVLLAQLLIESLDDLKDSTLYKQGTKNLINKIDKELSPLVRTYYDKMYNEDVLNSINIIDVAIEQIVHNAVVEVQELKPYNLFIVKGKDGRTTHIKTTLTPEEFEKQYSATIK